MCPGFDDRTQTLLSAAGEPEDESEHYNYLQVMHTVFLGELNRRIVDKYTKLHSFFCNCLKFLAF